MEITLKATLVEVLGADNGGVSCTVALTLEDDHTFESVYWAHANGNRVIEADPRFLHLFGATNTAALPFYNELLDWVQQSIPVLSELQKMIPRDDNPQL